jgi:hypothetical protein
MTIEEMVQAYQNAKEQEQAAIEARRLLEEKILAYMPHKDEGSTSLVLDDGRKVSATFKVTRKVDSDSLTSAWNTLSDHAKKAFKWKAEVDTKPMKALQMADEAAYLAASQFITATPAKPAISVK